MTEFRSTNDDINGGKLQSVHKARILWKMQITNCDWNDEKEEKKIYKINGLK